MSFAVILFLIFIPRKYNVSQLQKLKNLQYVTLPTGSHLAYVVIPAKGLKKPYPIIFLQGGPGGFISERTVACLAPLSENGYDIYLYDQIGSGHSARLKNIEEYTVERHKRDLEGIITHTGAAKVILIAQSWGAVLATLFVAGNPGKVAKLIFTSPGPVFPIRKELEVIVPPDSLHLRVPFFSNQQANKKINNIRSKTTALWAQIFGSKLASDKEVDDFQTLLANETNKSTVCDTSKAGKAAGGGGYYVQIMTMLSLDDVTDPRPALKNSKIPLFIMKGQCDNQKWGFITEYLELFPNHRLIIIPGAGHSISVEQPELYLNEIREFLNQ